MRPEGLEFVDVGLRFNFQEYTELEIDLKHVNKEARSSFTKHEVSNCVVALLNGLILGPSGSKEFGDEMCSYFVRSGEYDQKQFKLVICICSDKPKTIGVITLHRI